MTASQHPFPTCHHQLDQEIDLGNMMHTEWLLTNGLGGFAMGSLCNCNTRRYHSMLTCALHPPVQRVNFLASVGETMVIDGMHYELDTHEFHDMETKGSMIHPEGYQHLAGFDKDLTVRWTWQVGGFKLHKTLQLLWQRQLGLLRYRIEPVDPKNDQAWQVKLQLRPFLAMRDFHHLRRRRWNTEFQVQTNSPNAVAVTVDGLPTLNLATLRGSFTAQADWWHNFKLFRETMRRQDDIEDLFVPGIFEQTCTNTDNTMALMFGIDPIDWQLAEMPDPRQAHLQSIVEHTCRQVPAKLKAPVAILAMAADDFVVRRTVDDQPLSTILAGYPWFADWGRDTMISLPGILLTTGRYDEARKTLITYARYIRKGLLPNRFDDYGGEPGYNTVDAAMWFVHAALEYLRITQDHATWEQTLRPGCEQIIHWYQHGTDGPIHMDTDGLIIAGSTETQLTWMDAKRDGVIFTPRHGKPVEINALWYNALLGMAEQLGSADPDHRKVLEKLAKQVKQSFNATFWSDALGYCYDHVIDEHDEHGKLKTVFADGSLRPNQLIAVSLPRSPLNQSRQKKIVNVCRDKLLTPAGMRTLPTDDWHYHGLYTGSMFERDSAYHRGTVWAWPTGPFIEGWLRANKFSKKSRTEARKMIQPMLDNLCNDSVGQIHEIFDGDPPHAPKGCIAQAWSVAELLRVAVLIETENE